MPELSPDDRSDLLARLKLRHALARRDSSTSAWRYLQHVVIDTPPEPRLYRDAAEPWQLALASRLVPAIEAISGQRPDYTGPRSFWLTLPRGHDKTSLIGRLSSWALAFSSKAIRAVAAAADKDQAGFIAEFMQAEARLNPWVGELLHFANWRVEGLRQGSRLKILSADDKSSFGLKEDLMILDELTHWPKRGLFDTVVSGREKRPGSVLIIITNAGTLNTWQHDVFKQAKQSRDWYVYEAPGTIAGWMDADRLKELRKMLPVGLAKRLFDNKWTDPAEESGFVTREEAAACVDTFLSRREHGVKDRRPYYASVDYGVVKDRCVLTVGHLEDGKVICDRQDVWQGSHDNRIKVADVERWIEEVEKGFYHPKFVIDPYQMEGTLQKYEKYYDMHRFESRGGKTNYALAANLRSLVVNHRIAWYPQMGEILVKGKAHDLVDEFCEVTLAPRSYGFTIVNDGNTHDDRVVGLGSMALTAMQDAGKVVLPALTSRWF